jgi:hypothetical protein
VDWALPGDLKLNSIKMEGKKYFKSNLLMKIHASLKTMQSPQKAHFELSNSHNFKEPSIE